MSITLKVFDTNDINRHIDMVLPKYDTLKTEIVKLVKLNPNSLSKILWDEKTSPLIDRSCDDTLRKDMSSTKLNLNNINSTSKCQHCMFFGRLINENTNMIQIDIGKKNGNKLQFSYFENTYPRINVKEDSIETDKFTNALLSSFLIEDLLKKAGSTNINQLKTGFICGSTGYLVYTPPNLNSLSDFIDTYLKESDITSNSVGVIVGVLTQLFSIMVILKDSYVEFLNISDDSFKFLYKNINYEYDGVTISNGITLVLDTFNGVGMDVGKYRIHPKTMMDKELFNMNTYNHTYISCERGADPLCKTKERNFYKIDENSSITSYRGSDSIENGSLNIYLFILTMMSNQKIFNIFMSNDFLYSYWYDLWMPIEYEYILSDITEIHDKSPSQNQLYRILEKYKMRTDAIDYSWSFMKQMYVN